MSVFRWIEHEVESGICECYRVEAGTLREAVVLFRDFMASQGRDLLFDDDVGHAYCKKTLADFYLARSWVDVGQ